MAAPRTCSRSGVAGTEVFVAGSAVNSIRARASSEGATITRFSGNGTSVVTDTIAPGDDFKLLVFDDTYVAGGPGQPAAQLQIVFSGTLSYSISYRPTSQGE